MGNSGLNFLRSKGFKIKIIHSINKFPIIDRELIIPIFGSTVVSILAPGGAIEAKAEAKCSAKDQFSKKIGRTIALKRALAKMAPLLRDTMTQNQINELFHEIS